MTEASEREQATERSPEYEQARRRVEKKHKFRGDLAAYVLLTTSAALLLAASLV